MDKIKSIWLLLSPDAVLCCNEPSPPANAGADLISLDLFAKIAKRAVEQLWTCTILGNSNGIPKAYQALCDEMSARIILPAEFKGTASCEYTTIMFESSQAELVAKHPSVSRAILRVQRSHLSQLSEQVLALLHNFPDVSIRHPELLLYNNEDMINYKEQLFEIGRWLLDKNELWTSYRVDCLTDCFRLDIANECGAGVQNLAVGPIGELYLCPAVLRDGGQPCGHILGNLELPNRNLLTREYSVTCGKCDALRCLRCIYLNKRSTFEFCVPPKNICQLAHSELEVQAWFAQEAIKKHLWSQSYDVPKPPDIYDPYELVKVEDAPPIAHSWRRLVKFDGRPENLQPSMMLDIIHSLQGWCQSVVTCAEAGYTPSIELMERDVLAALRRRTIEQYRDIVFQEGCPTVREIELLVCSAAQKNINSL
jgi:CXXX repeat peptide maturase